MSRDLPALARATHPKPRRDWAGHPLPGLIVDALPTSRRGLTVDRVHLRLLEHSACDADEVRDCLAWLVHHGRVRTRGGYDRWPYEYLACPPVVRPAATIQPSLDDTEEDRR